MRLPMPFRPRKGISADDDEPDAVNPGRRPRITPPTQAELDTLPVEKRLELLNAGRHRAFDVVTSAVTSLGILLGVAFTAVGLFYTAQTLEATQQSQITDRYTRAVEQLDSKTIDVRLGAIYALGRIATDSDRDADTIQNVLSAFARTRFCTEKTQQCSAIAVADVDKISPTRLAADVLAALKLAITLTGSTDHSADLTSGSFRGADLGNVDLSRADLSFATLSGASFNSGKLADADLRQADLEYANLFTRIWPVRSC